MEHKTREQIAAVASVASAGEVGASLARLSEAVSTQAPAAVLNIADELAALPMTRRQKLERLADILEAAQPRDPRSKAGARIASLMRLEFLTEAERALVRCDNSPFHIAAQDPVLRDAGLSSDFYGEACKFFELSRDEAHYLVCDCHYHGSMTASDVAGRVRCVARRFSVREFWGRVWGVTESAPVPQ